ncbi:MAG: DEAD/DEAH box helicase [Chloroflexota bacterium]|nr:DEAD/DEAH box helicase [Chloroflexota bacterium]
MTTEFTVFNLHPELVQAVAQRGYTNPTPIQSAVIPVMLTGQDVIGQAQTGTGKTAAFALPILHNLAQNQGHVQSLVLAPTRELAIQVADFMYDYGQFRGVSVLAVYGGQPYSRQIRRLKKGVDIVVGTPGRLLDLIKKGVLDLSKVQTVILDEADEMLSMGFIEDIEAILSKTPSSHQTGLFSATLPAGIRRLANSYMNKPHSITTENKQLTVASIEQRYYLVNQKDKLAALTRLFEVEEITSALIFTRTRVGTGELANELTVRGFPAEALNGDLSQDARIRVLNRFKKNQIKVLVATDVAARGLDIDDISHVFNYDLPYDVEYYVHRVGRTGRAGKTGIAITLLTPAELWRLGRIEKYTKQKITRAALPTIEDIQKHRETQLLNQIEVWLRRGRCSRERQIVDDLVAGGVDPLEIAAVALKMARGEEKQRPIASLNEVRESRSRRDKREGKRGYKSHGKNGRKRSQRGIGSHEAGMVRLTLSKGKVHGVRPNDVVGTIASHANIPGYTIGKINIQENRTLVDVPEKYVAQVLSQNGNYWINKQNITVDRV